MKTYPEPAPNGSKRVQDATADARSLALVEWEALQSLCESLVEAGIRAGGPPLQPPPPPREITRL